LGGILTGCVTASPEQYFQEARRLKNTRQTEKSIGYYRQAAIAALQKLGPDSPVASNYLEHLGIIYRHTGRHFQANESFRRSLEIRKKIYGHIHLDVARFYNQLRVTKLAQGNKKDTIICQKRAVETYLQTVGKEHVEYGIVANNLALAHIKLDKFDKAEKIILKTLNIRKAAHGDEDAVYGVALHHYGLIKLKRSRYAEAETLFRRAQGVQQKDLLNPIFTIIAALTNIAYSVVAQQKYEEAESIYKARLQRIANMMGKDHPNYIDTLAFLAII
jgi:tetratricopeptide (TPR) repeat protein